MVAISVADCTTCRAKRQERPGNPTSIGRPFDECMTCGRLVSRSRFTEWGLMKSSTKLRCLGAAAIGWLGMGVLATLVLALGVVIFGRPLDVKNVLTVAVVVLVLAGALQGSRFSKELNRSRARMSDPMYRAKLIEFELATQGG